MVRLHTIFDKISLALDDFSYDELGISEEIKEQVFNSACFLSIGNY